MVVQGPYPPGAFGLPPGVNGDLPAAAYGAGLHLVSPQMNGAAAAAVAAAAAAAGYGRSPVVSTCNKSAEESLDGDDAWRISP